MPAGTDLVAAAARYTQRLFGAGVSRGDSSWHASAWGFYMDTTELRVAAQWVGNGMGRARLYAGKRLPDGSVDPLPPTHPASELVASIGGGPAGQAQLLTEYGPQLFVGGEGWTIIDQGKWYVVSTMEATTRGKDLEVEIEGVKRTVPLEPDDPRMADPDVPYAIRVWQPDPRRHQNADSPVRSSLVLLEELRLLNAAVAAVAKSRLVGRGALFISQGTQFPAAQGQAQSPDVIQEFVKVAETAYSNPNSAAAGVPLVMEVPVGGIVPTHLTFESEFDSLAVQLREECIRRFATGVDFPAEILLGTGDASHWGAWSFDEAGNRQAIFPRLRLVCDGWTNGWMIPALHAMDVPDADECLIWYDDKDLRVQTNRSETAVLLYDRGEISGEALRRETNFDDTDKPTKEEQDRSLLTGIVRDAPSTAPIILPILGINAPGLAEALQPFNPIVDGDTPVAPVVELPVAEDPGPPKVSEGLMAAADGLITRALERAGQKLKSSTARAHRGELEQIEAAAVHVATGCDEDTIEQKRLLDRAWDRAPGIAARYDVDPSDLTACLDRYTRELLCAGVEHEFELTAGALAPLLIPPPESAAEAS